MPPSSSLLARLSAIVALLFCTSAFAGTVTYNFQLSTSNGLPTGDVIIYTTGQGQEDVYLAPDTIPSTGLASLSQTLPFTPTRALIVGYNPGAQRREGPHHHAGQYGLHRRGRWPQME